MAQPAAPSHPAPRHPIPTALALRAEAVEIAAGRVLSGGPWPCTPEEYEALTDEAGEILDALSVLVCGDADALREVIEPEIRRHEAAYLVANHPEDAAVQRWLAAAAAYVAEGRS